VATITRYPFMRHLRADSNQYILLFNRGRVARSGPAISFWFNPLSAVIAQVPVEDCQATFVYRERTADFQEVNVQVNLTYRFADHARAASRFNFSISLYSGAWIEPPMERLAGIWSQRAQQPVRDYLVALPLVEALQRGAEPIRAAIATALAADPEIEAMGLLLVGVQVQSVLPSSELEKALQTPQREALQQKADEAVFQRRALAVEKERAIKENELATEIELARRQSDLLAQQGANRLLEVQQEAESEKQRVVAQGERETLAAEAAAAAARLKADADAYTNQSYYRELAAHEAARVELYRNAPQHVLLGLALQNAASKIESINHLNLTPDLLGASLQQFLRDQAEA
jgi:regulator of protease activity HflC (stomatin/prohibitin superfamily)